MIQYTTRILKFGSKGEKTGWTYIEVPADVAKKLKPGFKKSFRVKGKLDDHVIKAVAILPMGEGAFIMPLNAAMRKGFGKRHGAMLKVSIEEDKSEFKMDKDLMTCLKDEPEALKTFNEMPGSYQRYYSKWIAGAKTDATKAKRIANTITCMLKKMTFAEVLKAK